ncbi:MAG: nucleotidyltransferase family protein [Clostridia bacterium]
MSKLGIIAEYCPLHNGHIFHLQQSKNKTSCQNVICAMSGNFTQRGDIAVLNKYTRAKHALLAGADIVVEIPTIFVLSPAELYAKGAINTLKTFGIDYLAFGSELGDIDVLKNINTLIKNNKDTLDTLLKQNLKNGNCYPKSVADALQSLCENCFNSGDSGKNDVASSLQNLNISDIFSLPNNILALEYLKNLDNITPIAIKREGNYNSLATDLPFASASAIRQCKTNNTLDTIKDKMPQYSFCDLQQNSVNYEKLFALLSYKLATTSPTQLANIFDVLEGIENRFIACSSTSATYDEFLRQVKTKRYTMSKIKRIALNILLDNYKKTHTLPINYVNVLAVKRSKLDLLSCFNCNVITKPSDIQKFNLSNPSLQIDLLANALYNILATDKITNPSMLIL